LVGNNIKILYTVIKMKLIIMELCNAIREIMYKYFIFLSFRTKPHDELVDNDTFFNDCEYDLKNGILMIR
jgi:hypothetical protein